MVSAQLEGPLLEQYEDAEEDEDGGNKSEFLRSVLRDGLRTRNISTYEQAGLSRRISGQLEDERPVGDTQEDILREVIEDGLEARRGDVLDTLGASDELRDRVEEAREEGETLDDAVRRLLRVGIASAGDENSTSRLTAAGVVLVLGGVPAALASTGNVESAFAIVLTLVLWVLFGGAVSSGMEYVRSRVGF